jgi:hypothetical protein
MMTFHILNGDALAEQLEAKLEGNQIIFRECLIEGPIQANSEDEFWEMRKEYIESTFGTNPPYEEYSRSEISKIGNTTAEDEVFFWFEEDCFCQVNFWKACSILKAIPKKAALVLPGPDSPYSFGKLCSEQLIPRFQSSQELKKSDLELFATLWRFYQIEDIKQLEMAAQSSYSKFPFLAQAIRSVKEIKLDDLHLKTLESIHKDLAIDQFHLIFQEFQRRAPSYGLGDFQVFNLWNKVKKMG